jgi:hypothetical protein
MKHFRKEARQAYSCRAQASPPSEQMPLRGGRSRRTLVRQAPGLLAYVSSWSRVGADDQTTNGFTEPLFWSPPLSAAAPALALGEGAGSKRGTGFGSTDSECGRDSSDRDSLTCSGGGGGSLNSD